MDGAGGHRPAQEENRTGDGDNQDQGSQGIPMARRPGWRTLRRRVIAGTVARVVAGAVKRQHALVPGAGPHQMGKALGQFGEFRLPVLKGVDPVAGGQFVEKRAAGRDVFQSDRDNQFFLEHGGCQLLGDVARLGRIGGEQQHENLAVLQRLGGGEAPILASPNLGVVPGLDAFDLKLGVQQPRPARVRPPVADENLARH